MHIGFDISRDAVQNCVNCVVESSSRGTTDCCNLWRCIQRMAKCRGLFETSSPWTEASLTYVKVGGIQPSCGSASSWCIAMILCLALMAYPISTRRQWKWYFFLSTFDIERWTFSLTVQVRSGNREFNMREYIYNATKVCHTCRCPRRANVKNHAP